METTEKIVEAYVRYIKGWFTIPNLKCDGQKEVDLLAVDVSSKKSVRRYHIETSVSISGSFSKLTNKPFSADAYKIPVRKAEQRRTLGYFMKRKFEDPHVLRKIKEYGFVPGNYQKIIVSWGFKEDVHDAALNAGINLWDLEEKLEEIAILFKKNKAHFVDDTMRTLQLMAIAVQHKNKTQNKN
jgi:hypothetical protein